MCVQLFFLSEIHNKKRFHNKNLLSCSMIFKPKISEQAFGCSYPVDADFNFIFQLFFYNIESPDNISILFLKNVTLNLHSINFVKNKNQAYYNFKFSYHLCFKKLDSLVKYFWRNIEKGGGNRRRRNTLNTVI